MLRKQLYVIFTKPVNGMEPIMAISRSISISRSIWRSAASCSAPGRCGTTPKTPGKAKAWWSCAPASLAEAKAIAASDPMHKAGARSFTVRPWLINEGTVTIKLSYSDGKFDII